MKDNFDNIEDLFRERFNNFEADVDPKIWENISNQVNNPAPVQDPASSAVSGSSGAGAGAGIVKIAAVAGTAGLISVAGYMYFSSDSQDEITENVVAVESPVLESEITTEDANEIVLDDFSSEPIVDNENPEKIATEVPSTGNGNSQSLTATPPAAVNSEASTKETSAPSQPVAQQNQTQVQPNKPASQVSQNSSAPVVQREQKPRFEASIHSSVQKGTSPLTVNFENRGSHAHDVTWYFGDGSFVSSESRTEHTFDNIGSYWVILEIRNDQGQKSRDSVQIFVKGNTVINAPNVFTPNGDGYNDGFVVETENVETLNCKILDRTGRVIYEWNNIYGHWDGRDMVGNQVPSGVYFFVITAADAEGNPIEPKKGTVTLSR